MIYMNFHKMVRQSLIIGFYFYLKHFVLDFLFLYFAQCLSRTVNAHFRPCYGNFRVGIQGWNTVKILNELRKTKDYPKDRGLSVDCSFMTALICLGQLVSSAIVGVLIESYGSSRTRIHNPIKSHLLTSVETITWVLNGSWIPEKNYKSLYICHCSCWLFALLVYC